LQETKRYSLHCNLSAKVDRNKRLKHPDEEKKVDRAVTALASLYTSPQLAPTLAFTKGTPVSCAHIEDSHKTAHFEMRNIDT
jgi:hypothetical protein